MGWKTGSTRHVEGPQLAQLEPRALRYVHYMKTLALSYAQAGRIQPFLEPLDPTPF